MKTVHLFLDDDQHEKLVKAKGGMSWVDFIMKFVDGE